MERHLRGLLDGLVKVAIKQGSPALADHLRASIRKHGAPTLTAVTFRMVAVPHALSGGKARNPCLIINVHRSAPGPTRRTCKPAKGWMRAMLDRHGLMFHLSPPKADRHRSGGTVHGRRRNYAIPDTPERLADYVEWISYLAKARSKPDDIRGIYFSSKDSKHV